MNDRDKHHHCTNKFIELANELKDGDYEIHLVSAALMSASCIYTTYVAAGNEGGLNPSGVDKIVAMFRRNLEHIQEVKKREAEQKQAESQD